MPTSSRSPKRPTQSPQSHSDPYRLAEVFLRRFGYDAEGTLILRYWRGAMWRLEGGAYRPVPEGEFEADLNSAIQDDLRRVNATGPRTLKAIPVTQSLLDSVRGAVQAMTLARDLPPRELPLAHLSGGEKAA